MATLPFWVYPHFLAKKFIPPQVTQFLEGPTPLPFLIRWGGAGFPIVGGPWGAWGHAPHLTNFFETPPPPKLMPPHGAPPHLKKTLPTET